MSDFTIGDDMLDSRDIILRIDELETQEALDEDEAEELQTLIDLDAVGVQIASDWQHGEVLVHDSYFTEYAEELAKDLGFINGETEGWPFRHIDWDEAAEELKGDYAELTTDTGDTYWVRNG